MERCNPYQRNPFTTMSQSPTNSLKTPPQHRIELEDMYRDFQDGLLTVKGAVFYAVATSRRFGEPVQLNVSEFLSRTGIHRRSYARALSELVAANRLDFPPNSTQTLRVPVSGDAREPLYYSLGEPKGQICPESGQICHRSGQICPENGQICPENGQICPDRPLETPPVKGSESPLLSYSSIDLSLSEPERDQNDFEEEYTEWLTKRASELPKKPALLQQWIAKNRTKKTNRAEFSKWKETRDRASKVPPTATATAIFETENTQQRFETLQHLWETNQIARVQATIAANPGWGLYVGEFGVEVRQ